MSMSELKVGDVVKSLKKCDALPAGTVVGYAHPVYQMPVAAVRWTDAFGELLWATTGSGSARTTTRQIKESSGWAPFVILALPDQNFNPQPDKERIFRG